jgi:hypothetical protein
MRVLHHTPAVRAAGRAGAAADQSGRKRTDVESTDVAQTSTQRNSAMKSQLCVGNSSTIKVAKQVTVEEAVAGVNALMEQSKQTANERPARKRETQFAVPQPYFAISTGASPDELDAMKAEAKKLQAIVDDPATGVIERQRNEYRLTAVRARIEQIEAALYPEKQVGKGATAGNDAAMQLYATPTPYWKTGKE